MPTLDRLFFHRMKVLKKQGRTRERLSGMFEPEVVSGWNSPDKYPISIGIRRGPVACGLQLFRIFLPTIRIITLLSIIAFC